MPIRPPTKLSDHGERQQRGDRLRERHGRKAAATAASAGRRTSRCGAASHRLTTLVMVASTAAAGGTAITRKSISRLDIVDAGHGERVAGAAGFHAAAHCIERVVQAGAEAFRVGAEIGDGARPPPARRASRPRSPAARADTIRARGAAAIAAAPGAPAWRDSRATRPARRRRPERRRRTPSRTPRRARRRRRARAISAAQWLQPSAAIMIGSGAR